MLTYMHICTYMLFTHSGSKQVHVDTPTNVTELNWNRVLNSTHICMWVGFYPDRSRS